MNTVHDQRIEVTESRTAEASAQESATEWSEDTSLFEFTEAIGNDKQALIYDIIASLEAEEEN